MTASQQGEDHPMYPHDIPDTAHPLSGDAVTQSVQEFIDLEVSAEPLAMSPEWIRSEALHAAVAHAGMWMSNGSDAWNTGDVLRVAEVYRGYISGETS